LSDVFGRNLSQIAVGGGSWSEVPSLHDVSHSGAGDPGIC